MSRTEQLHVTVQGYECLGIKEGSRIVITWGDADQAKIAKVETKIHRMRTPGQNGTLTVGNPTP